MKKPKTTNDGFWAPVSQFISDCLCFSTPKLYIVLMYEVLDFCTGHNPCMVILFLATVQTVRYCLMRKIFVCFLFLLTTFLYPMEAFALVHTLHAIWK